MKAIQVHQFGGPEVLAASRSSHSQARPGTSSRARARRGRQSLRHLHAQRHLRRQAAAALYARLRRGRHLEAVGEGVKKVKPGDRVYTATTLTGAYAEYALARESQVYPLPEKISFAQGAGLWVPYGTAYTALHHHAHARAGETLLVHGASGGVGIAAVQFARAHGLDRDRHGRNASAAWNSSRKKARITPSTTPKPAMPRKF